MGKDAFDGGFCTDSLGYYPIDQLIPGLPHDIGILMVITGAVNIIMSLITVGWIKKNEREAQAEYGREEAAKSVIFPVFVNMMWLTIASNIFAGAVTAFVPFNPSGSNTTTASLLYALVMAVRHGINEGIAFLLTKKGCGFHAAKTAGRNALIWSIVTFAMLFYVYQGDGYFTEGMEILWDFCLLSFYVTLWIAPEDQIFRRPAVKFYSQFWATYAFLSIIINVFFLFGDTDSLGNCSYVLTNVLLIAIFSPLIIYWTLLQDSRWWQGLDLGKNFAAIDEDEDTMRVPLMGNDFSLSSAQSLAQTLDQMRVHRVKMLNFACIKIDFRKPLGGGSFSKVYRGTYRGVDCAIKLIYTVDLTFDVIQRVAAEASILSSLQHPNIVNIFGVSVLPPSVCLILEICQFGSLSDVIRGYGFDWNTSHRYPLTCSHLDILYLALGCARGVAAIHSLNSSICHRDIKSFNFLVDRNFTVKIADLELGLPSSNGSSSSSTSSSFAMSNGSQSATPLRPFTSNHEANLLSAAGKVDPGLICIEDRLANWLAPEVIAERRFQQASDIYALGTVFWELLAKRLPFEDDTQPVIREKLLQGYMHPFPEDQVDSPLSILIQRCWSLLPQERPTAKQIVKILEDMLSYGFTEHVKEITYSQVNIAAVREFYEARYRRHTLLSDDRSTTGSGLRLSQPLQAPSWWDRILTTLSNPWTLLPRNSDFSIDVGRGTASLRDIDGRVTTYAIPQIRPLDILPSHAFGLPTDEDEDERTSSDTGGEAGTNPLSGPPTTVPPRLPLRTTVPLVVQEAIGQIKTERYWRNLEATGDAWCAITVEPPHVVLHGTSRWFAIFNACSAFGADHHLWSLAALIHPAIRAPDSNCSASNSLALAASTTPVATSSSSASAAGRGRRHSTLSGGEDTTGFEALQTQCANDFLALLARGGQAHGTLCFHLLDPTPSHSTGAASASSAVGSGGGFRAHSRRDYSVSEGSHSHNAGIGGHGRSGHNMMCSAHAYPVFAPRTAAPTIPPPTSAPTVSLPSVDEGSTSPMSPNRSRSGGGAMAAGNSFFRNRTSSTTPPMTSPSPSRASSTVQPNLASSTSGSGQYSAPSIAPVTPIYYLLHLQELLEVHTPPDHRSQRASSLSTTFLSHLSSHRSSERERYEDDEEDDEDENGEADDVIADSDEDDDARESFITKTVGRFWSGTRRGSKYLPL